MARRAGKGDDQLGTLNDSEREVLSFLALGHTIKSIALTTGRTEAWINERLRDARRKTGSISSRELARRLHPNSSGTEGLGSDKNGHSEIDLPDAPGRRSSGSCTGWLSRHAGVMSGGGLVITVAIVCAALALSSGGDQVAPVPQAARGEVSDVVIAVPRRRASHLVKVVLTSGTRRLPPQAIVAPEHQMVSFTTGDVQVHLVLTPTPAGNGTVDIALAAELSDSSVRRRISTTVTVASGAPFRVALPARDGAPAASIDLTVTPVAAID